MTFNLFVRGRDRYFTVCIFFKETLFFNFSYKLFLKIMKKLYMYTIIGSSGRDCVLIKLGFLKVIYSGLVSITLPLPLPNLYVGRKTNPVLI